MIDPQAPDYGNTPAAATRARFGYAPHGPVLMPALTLVTPFFNTGPVFRETVDSVLRQSFQQWEWIIVNDCSTEPGAVATLDSLRDCDSRIRVIDLDVNRGPGAARNVGYAMARAPYVLQLDSDNLLEPTAAEKWLWFLESNPEAAFVKGFSVGFGAERYLWQRGFHEGRTFLQQNLVDATSLVRKQVHQAAGGYDESIRGGLEDWDFWLRCAAAGHWGSTVPEYLDWYRRRASHAERWPTWDEGDKQRRFHRDLLARFPTLRRTFPEPKPRWHDANEAVSDVLPFSNPLNKAHPRTLLIVPWLTLGGADKFNLDLTEQLTRRGWQVTIATTNRGDNSWAPRFARYTPDLFILDNFLRLSDYPRFLRYLIESRSIDTVVVSHSEAGYLLLPYLRAHFPDVAFIDYCHIEEEHWKNGGYPRLSVEYQAFLDRTVVSSEHLRRWMVKEGGAGDRIRVVTSNIDAKDWTPDPAARARVRGQFDVAEDTPVVLFAGRICDQKQPSLLASTAAALKAAGLNFQLWVAGAGPDLPSLETAVADAGVDDVIRLLGAVSNEKIRELMAAADVFFLPSKWEGIALSIYEAMASGLPIVAADVGGQSELVTSSCGFLITRSDAADETRAYARALEHLLRNKTLRETMGGEGRSRVLSEFDIASMGERMVEVLEEAIRSNAEDPRPRPTPAFGKTAAFQAVETIRLFRLADWLWAERDTENRRVRAYQFVARRLEGVYAWGVKRGWYWLAPLKARVKLAVLGRV